MKIFRAKVAFHDLADFWVFKGQAFICESKSDLPVPANGTVELVFEEIVPKNMLISLSSFVKTRSL